METRDIFLNISPLDHRYYKSNREVFDRLGEYMSEEAVIVYCAKAEVALLKTHIEMQFDGDADLLKSIEGMAESIEPDEVYTEEEKTRHNIRALVNILNNKVPKKLKPYVHLGATSVDILDTATSMRCRDVSLNVLLPLLCDLEESLIDFAEREAATPQVGRTHGQHAVPITLGFAMAEYVSRLGQSIKEIDRLSRDLRGKLAGAVGAYNAASIISSDPFEMERVYLEHLNLKPSEYSTQMVEPEYLLRLLLEYNTAFGVIANLADDLRHLQRSEIDEVREFFAAEQVGSSTMPQKRNPWNCEHVKSLWKAFSPRVMTFYMDQISEHQRDLTNSASSRFVADYFAGFAAAVARMLKIIKGLTVNNDQLQKNLTGRGDMVLAEPTYILLALTGVNGAHEIIRNVTLKGDKEGKTIREVLTSDYPEVWESISIKLKDITGIDPDQFYDDPSLYNGKSVEKTKMLTKQYSKLLKEVRGGERY